MRYIKMKDVIATRIIRLIFSFVLLISFSGLAVAQTEPVFVQKDFQPTFQNVTPLNISNTGAATYNIPIIVPPGRGGIAMPDLALVYNSQQRNGWVGMGWDLEVGSIQRSTKCKWGVNYDSGTDFVLDGSIELVQRTDWDGPGGIGPHPGGSHHHYGAKIEGGFTKYWFEHPIEGWVATTRDETKYYYGQTAASRQQENNSKIFKWCLDKVVDSNGNTMTITYYKDNNGEIYPAEIYYPGNNNVKFILESTPRHDKPPRYNTTWKVVTAYRLKTIEVYGNGQLARKYVLTYDQGTSSGRSRLIEVKVYGSNGSTILPTMKFGWQEGGDGHFGNGQRKQLAHDITNCITCYKRFADLDGDGNDDFLMTYDYGSNVDAYLSQGDGTFGAVKQTTLNNGSGAYVYLFDVNGDGKADLVRCDSNNIYTYLSKGTGYFEQYSQHSTLSAYGAKYIADVNGDGLADIVQMYGGAVYPHLSNGNGTFRSVDPMAVGQGDISLGDVNGDGLADIVFVPTNSENNVYTFFSNGDGTFSTLILHTFGNGIYGLQITDVNGDGLGDFISRYYSTVYTCLSHGDGTYSDCVSKDLAPTNVSFADINGDGSVDLIAHLLSSTIDVYLGQGDGTFGVVAIESNVGPGGPGFYFADLNGDGLSDVSNPWLNGSTPYIYTHLANGAPLISSPPLKMGLGPKSPSAINPHLPTPRIPRVQACPSS